MSAGKIRVWAAAVVLLAAHLPASAHDGPPFPIISDKKMGNYKVSLWTHPDIGTGTFWVVIDAAPGEAIPKDLKVVVAVEPVNHRIPERRFNAVLDESSNQPQYKALIPFDRQEYVQARLHLESTQLAGDASATVEITPPGPTSRWSLVLYLAPFLVAGFLWFRAMTSRPKHNA